MDVGGASGSGGSTAGQRGRKYDKLTAEQVVRQLPRLSTKALHGVRQYEASHKGRATVLNALDALIAARHEAVETEAAESTTSAPRCVSCDAVVGRDVNFCPNCGAAVAQKPREEADEEESNKSPDRASFDWTSFWRRRTAIIVGIAVLVAAMGSGIIILSRRGGRETNAVATVAVATTSSTDETTTSTTEIPTTTTLDPQQGFLAALDAEHLRDPTTGDSDDRMVSNGKSICDEGHAGEAPSLTDKGRTPSEALANELLPSPIPGEGTDDPKYKRRAELAIQFLCPDLLPLLHQVETGHIQKSPLLTKFGDGTFKVNGDIAPGTYATGGVSDCYWARVDANGRTIANDFVTGAPRVQVTILASDAGFTSRGCEEWDRVG